MRLPAFREGAGDLLLHSGRDLAGPAQARSPVPHDNEPCRVADLVLRGPWVERVVSPRQVLQRRPGDLDIPLRIIGLEAPS